MRSQGAGRAQVPREPARMQRRDDICPWGFLARTSPNLIKIGANVHNFRFLHFLLNLALSGGVSVGLWALSETAPFALLLTLRK